MHVSSDVTSTKKKLIRTFNLKSGPVPNKQKNIRVYTLPLLICGIIVQKKTIDISNKTSTLTRSMYISKNICRSVN